MYYITHFETLCELRLTHSTSEVHFCIEGTTISQQSYSNLNGAGFRNHVIQTNDMGHHVFVSASIFDCNVLMYIHYLSIYNMLTHEISKYQISIFKINKQKYLICHLHVI
jgi:hypothetical protein